ncbi:MAG: ABC transporter ATP-binding protein [Pirellulales bacterium]|nr:ABC transporter ATP-binding protein [Pirellulales bacterium]
MPFTPVLAFENVSFSYGSVPVLENASFSILERESVCIVGPNGGGKTTLVKLVLGLLEPSAGEIRVFGGSPKAVRPRIGYMPQHLLYDPLFPVTVRDIVLMGRLKSGGVRGFFGWPDGEDRDAAADALRRVGMEDFCRRSFSSLSGGQRQRVLIARALAGRPDLLLLDEPTASVDTLVEARLLDLLRELNERMTIAMVTHDLGFVAEMVEKVVCVNRRVVVHSTADISGEMIHDIYGGHVRMVRHDGERG